MTIEKENFYTLLSIDAWKDMGGWQWNNMHLIEEDIFLSEGIERKPRSLLAFIRRNGWLTKESKGLLAVIDTGYDIEIVNRKTYEPILAFRPQWPM